MTSLNRRFVFKSNKQIVRCVGLIGLKSGLEQSSRLGGLVKLKKYKNPRKTRIGQRHPNNPLNTALKPASSGMQVCQAFQATKPGSLCAHCHIYVLGSNILSKIYPSRYMNIANFMVEDLLEFTKEHLKIKKSWGRIPPLRDFAFRILLGLHMLTHVPPSPTCKYLPIPMGMIFQHQL